MSQAKRTSPLARLIFLVPLTFAVLFVSGCTIERVESDGDKHAASGKDDQTNKTNGHDVRPADGKKPTVAYVTNGIASFWEVAAAGCRAAEKDFNVNVEIRMPPTEGGRIVNQQRMIEDLLTLQVDGIAVSPIDPDNQTPFLNQVAERTNLITHDSDAPNSNRLAYIGMSNYDAGRMCGDLVKEAVPDGGNVMIFVGSLDQLNARQRRQGLIDVLLDRTYDDNRYDPPSAELKGDKYSILGTRVDNFDFGRAKSIVEEALTAGDKIDCMVGLFAYNPPKMLDALKDADKLGKIKVVGFDEEGGTLQGIVDGYCYGTVVQNPYMYGYESVRVLAGLAKGDKSVIPEGGYMDIPARKITKDNVEEFWTKLKSLMAGKSSPAQAQSQPAEKKVQLAFVTNNPSDFWRIAEAGVRKAEKDFNAECELRMPPNGTADDQQRIIEELISRGIQGMAISPNDVENQIGIINQACQDMHVICQDSDAPKSNRTAYVGTRNYDAGREAGKLIKEVLPDGGEIMLFVGRIDAQNAIERRDGIVDEIKGHNIKILDLKIDLTDRARAKQNVEETLIAHPDVDCLVGLWSYNGPAILDAVKDAGLAGKMPIVCFDEEDPTLQGVIDGYIHATVVQQPYEFGYQSVRILAALARGQDAGIPDDKIVEVPVKVIRQDNAKAFWENLKKLKDGGQ